MKTKDVIAKVQDKLLSLMEKHGTDWAKSWASSNVDGLPFNKFTGTVYDGINIFILSCSAEDNGYQSNQWATAKNWKDAGYLVKKGERAEHILFSKPIKTESKTETDADGNPLVKNYWCNKSYAVFNAEQIEGYEIEKPKTNEISKLELIETVEQYVKNTGASIHHGGNRAFFTPNYDEIHMPKPEQFKSTGTSTAQENYYGTLLHELIHWTGYKDRLNRIKGRTFGDNDYAFEELVAESGSAILCTLLGISAEPRPDHAKYLNSWIRGVKDNPNAMISAFKLSSKAIKYLDDLQSKKQMVA